MIGSAIKRSYVGQEDLFEDYIFRHRGNNHDIVSRASKWDSCISFKVDLMFYLRAI